MDGLVVFFLGGEDELIVKSSTDVWVRETWIDLTGRRGGREAWRHVGVAVEVSNRAIEVPRFAWIS